MKRLLTLVAVLVAVTACGSQETLKEQDHMSFIDMHCREHASDYPDFSPSVYDDCVELHTYGLVITDSEDEHLSALHW